MSETPPEQSMHQQMARRLRHEIGDFLQKVYATVAILNKRLPEDFVQEREVLTRLRARAEICKHLLDDVQDFLCPMVVACEPLDWVELTERAMSASRQRHPNVDIRREGDSSVRIEIDPARITQVMEALMRNAAEAGASSLRVLCRRAPQSGQVEWSITDNGPGVPSEQLDQLFQPFFTTRTSHAGLGLTLVQKIVEQHRGQVRAENAAQGGFRVTLFLPHEAASSSTS